MERDKGNLFLNNEGRFEVLNNGKYFTCGDLLTLHLENQVLHGRVEYTDDRYYLFVPGLNVPVFLSEGMLVSWNENL